MKTFFGELTSKFEGAVIFDVNRGWPASREERGRRILRGTANLQGISTRRLMVMVEYGATSREHLDS